MSRGWEGGKYFREKKPPVQRAWGRDTWVRDAAERQLDCAEAKQG